MRNFQKIFISIIGQIEIDSTHFLNRPVLKTEQAGFLGVQVADETANCDWNEWRFGQYLWFETAGEAARAPGS